MNTTLSSVVADATTHSQPQLVELPDEEQLRSLSVAHRLSLRVALWLLVRANGALGHTDRARAAHLVEQRRRDALAEHQALVARHLPPLRMF